MVYKWGLGYFSYFCNANHIQRGNAAHKKSVTTWSKGILAPDRALWRIFVLVCDWRPTNRLGAFSFPLFSGVYRFSSSSTCRFHSAR